MSGDTSSWWRVVYERQIGYNLQTQSRHGRPLSGGLPPGPIPTGLRRFAEYNFTSGGKVEQTSLAGTVELDYTFKDSKVMLGPEGSRQVLSFDKDGCIDVPLVGRLCKAAKK